MAAAICNVKSQQVATRVCTPEAHVLLHALQAVVTHEKQPDGTHGTDAGGFGCPSHSRGSIGLRAGLTQVLLLETCVLVPSHAHGPYPLVHIQWLMVVLYGGDCAVAQAAVVGWHVHPQAQLAGQLPAGQLRSRPVQS